MKSTHVIPGILKYFGTILLVLLTTIPGIIVVSAQDLDQKYIDLVSANPEPLITEQSSQISEPGFVRIIYLIPADSIEKPEYTIALENATRHLQMWYYNALGLNKTFALYDPVVEVYQTPHDALWYSTNPNGSSSSWFWNNVLQDGFQLTGGFSGDYYNIWIFYIDANNGCDQAGGSGWDGKVVISANDLKGLVGYAIDKSCPNVIHSYKSGRYVGGLGHELGHGLKLLHPPECDEDFPTCWDHDLMMYGYIKYPDAYFNESDKARLSNNRFIRDIDIEGLWYPTSCMDLNDTCNFSFVSQKSILCGDSILLEGRYQKTSGIYHDTIHFAAGCDSIIETYLTVETPPPEVEDVWICEGDSVAELIAIGQNIKWYDDADLSNLVFSGETLNTGQTALGTYQYYATQTISDCTSLPIPVTLTIRNVPSPPITEDNHCCEGEYIEYLRVDAGNDINWYADPELKNHLSSITSIDVRDIVEPGTYIFYVTETMSGCESSPSALNYTIKSLPQVPLTEDVAICENESSAVLVAKGENITWYRAADYDLTDLRDGQEYKGVKIGNQIWMAENLNYYTPSDSWYYNDDSSSYAGIYGRLYDFENARKVCPSGWHLPAYDEWYELIDFLGGDSIAAGILKEQGTSHWISPNTDATNEGGFTALPAGFLYDTFRSMGEEAYIWSSRAIWEMGISFKLTYNSSAITERRLYMLGEGASIRCIKDSIYDIMEFGDTLVLPNTHTGTFPFYVTQTISNCEGPSTMATLTINPVPEAPQLNDTTIFINQDIVLDVGIPDYLYSWSDGSDLSLCKISGSELGPGEHTYWVVVTDTSSCTASDSILITVIDPSGSAFAHGRNSMKIYPNPVNDLITVQTGKTGEFTVEITSINGRIIHTGDFSGSSYQTDLSSFPKGAYFIRIRSSESITTRKIIKL